MDCKGLSSWNRLELKAYRLLGVNQFCKAILLFEKIKHRKDNRKNENYHPYSYDVFALERYNGFILYNAFLHGASLILTVVFFLVSTAVQFRNVVLDSGMILLTLINVYCIILQRTNYLKSKELRYKYFKRILDKTDLCGEETLQQVYALEPQKLRADYGVLSRIREAFEGRSDCTLTHNDVGSLQRICVCFAPAGAKKNNRNQAGLQAGLTEQWDPASRPYTVLQMRADRLQRLFRVPGRKMLDRTAIITEDAACEMLYKKLIPEDTAYNVCLVCVLLYEAFAGMIGKVEANEA